MKKEVKTSIEGLEIGMFVSRLDKPWIETPFPLEGVMIKSPSDIAEIKKYCTHAYVDVEKGESPHPRFWILKERRLTKITSQENVAEKLEKSRQQNEYDKYRKQSYKDSVRFEDELDNAKETYEKLGTDYKNLLEDLKKGKDLDVEIVREGVKQMVASVIKNPAAMMWMVQLRKLDDYSYSRSLGTSVWCATFGRHLGLDRETIQNLSIGGLLLDIGKTQIDQTLLEKSGNLTAAEKREMMLHVDYGIKLLVKASSSGTEQKLPVDVLQMVAVHHERADGSGYPQGIRNVEIPLAGRIAGIIDSYDAMTSDRPYLEAGPSSPHKAIAELYKLRGSRFQAELVEQFIQAVGLYPTGSLVELSTGEVGAVVKINGLRRLRPSVMLLLDTDKKPLPIFRHINLSQMDESIAVERGLPVGAYGINMEELFL